MTSRNPEPPSQMEAEGIPDLADPDPSETEFVEPPHDTAMAVDDFGTTPGEQADGESLDGRLAREEPDVLAGSDVSDGIGGPGGQGAGQGIGRLVASDEGARGDAESDLLATDVGTDLGGYSAEEAAMHLEPEA